MTIRMRTIDQAYEYVLSQDAETSLTKTALRRLVTSGKLPSVTVGNKYLISLETLEEYMSGSMPAPASDPNEHSRIRRINI